MNKIRLRLSCIIAVIVLSALITSPVFAASPKLSQTRIQAASGSKEQTIALKNAGRNPDIKWTSNQPDIVKVKKDSSNPAKATLRFKNAGTTHVKATLNGKTYSCKVTVTPVLSMSVLDIDYSAKTYPLVLKGVTENTVKWSTTNPNAAVMGCPPGANHSPDKCYIVPTMRIGTLPASTVISAAYNGRQYKCVVRVWPALFRVNGTSVYAKMPLNQPQVAALSKAAKGRVSDVIAIAATQDGYECVNPESRTYRECDQARKKYTWFAQGDWNIALRNYNLQKNQMGDYCSEFLYWCLYQAKVPGITLNSRIATLENFRDKCPAFGTLYKFAPSIKYSVKRHASTNQQIISKWFGSRKTGGTLSGTAALMPGDILQICKDSYPFMDIPHHIAFFVKSSGTDVVVMEGNDPLATPYRSVNTSQTRTYHDHEVFAVIRPRYNR